MNKLNMVGHGLVMPKQILPEEFVFGAKQLPETIIQDNGNWTAYLPEKEKQARLNFDTFGCTIYNSISPIEILERKIFGESSEYAERPVYIGTGTRPPGNSPHVILEWIRNNGLVPEIMLPFTDELKSLDEYASPNPLTSDLINEGKKWVDRKTLGHEWLWG